MSYGIRKIVSYEEQVFIEAGRHPRRWYGRSALLR